MKQWIIRICVALLAIAVFVVLVIVAVRQGKEISRLRDNYTAEVRRELDVQQEVTRKELKQLFSQEVAILKEHGIKSGQIENIVNVEYRLIDSVRYRDTLVWVYDTLKSVRRTDFEINADCYSLEGQIVGDTLEIGCMSVNDAVLISLYKERRKCLFQKRRVKAIAIGACGGDTLAILRNIKVVK